ncbi:erythromycin esterase family protein [Kitasatospora camelliae]|uniref:Erythromycin esterase family protein n=1 Tax=Kitasatospora camelliae TaxID=3156397 RepID=A0AAU8JQN2_9ACTN
MDQDIHAYVTESCTLLALGEPTHREPAFGRVRNRLFERLVEAGFRSIALETDRVAALAVDEYVREGTGTLDAALDEGFSHGFGELAPNRELISWMREFNRTRPPAYRLSFHGFDAPMETMSAPGPLRYLEHARDYLRLVREPGGQDGPKFLDLAGLAGDEERWSRTEAVLDPAASPGATAEAQRLRVVADDLLVLLHVRAAELIAATSHREWLRARTHLTAGLDLLRYHRQSARPLDQGARISGLSAVRDAFMVRNLLEIRELEARRGPTLVFGHNLHLHRTVSTMGMGDVELRWHGAGANLASLIGDQYAFVAGSLGRSETLGLRDPAPDSHEGELQRRTAGAWGLTPAAAVTGTRSRTDTARERGYIPLDRATLDGADAVLHITDGGAVDAG